jgi:alkanesulfonate monooxygenase SsuD/methylene tetrahydromethanopterin reductase-like flavin-dependent oxidoreductase (luciferase family)
VAGPPLRVDLFLIAGQFPDAGHGDTLRTAVHYAQTAEQAGFDGVWIAEHHFVDYGVCPSGVTMAGFLLGRTSRVRVGTAAAVLPTRHPVALAEEAALLDAVSGGRFDLGVGRGGPWADLEVFGTGLDRYTREGFTEALDLLLAALSGQASIRGDGARFRFRDVTMVPRPPRRMPVWIASTSPASAAIAAVRGLPLLLGMHEDNLAKSAMIEHYTNTGRPHSVAAAIDDQQTAHASAHLAYVADTVEEAERILRGTLPAWLATTGQHVRIDGSTATRNLGAYLEHLLAIHPVGPPDRCIQRLTDTVNHGGVRRLLLMVEGGGTQKLTVQNIERLGAEVLPALRQI